MRVITMSRAEAESSNPFDVPHAIISITDSPALRGSKASPAITPFTRAVHFLAFDDIWRDPGQSWRGVYGEPVMFDHALAQQTAVFIHQWVDAECGGLREWGAARSGITGFGFLIHCEAGVSRSVAMGAAITTFFLGRGCGLFRRRDGSDISEARRLIGSRRQAQAQMGNPLVYWSLLAALGMRAAEDRKSRNPL